MKNIRNILVLNAGSSSLKYSLFNSVRNNIQDVLATGVIEQIGQPKQTIKHKILANNKYSKLEFSEENLNYQSALEQCLSLLKNTGELTIDGVGHRVVHGGEKFSTPKLVDGDVIQAIREASVLAPLHNPANLIGIETAMGKLSNNCPHVAVFDTAFHTTLPPSSYLYALPMEYYEKYGIRKYGFHGTSHDYVMRKAAKYLNKPEDSINLISCHLGAGSSICCIKNGQSIDTSMGLTPLEGLVMATRCGDIDASVVFHLVKEAGLTMDEVEELLVKRSGWSGLCGDVNARNIETGVRNNNETHVLTKSIMVHRIRKYIGAYLLTLGGEVDAIVMTAGLGENWPLLRLWCLENLQKFGIEVDQDKNMGVISKDSCTDISTFRSGIKILVVPTDEERHIAKQTLQVINKLP